jgi:hypothetical protein
MTMTTTAEEDIIIMSMERGSLCCDIYVYIYIYIYIFNIILYYIDVRTPRRRQRRSAR